MISAAVTARMLSRAQEWDSPENHIPPDEIYAYCYTAQVKPLS